MNSNKYTPHHTYQLVIFILVFIIALVTLAWIYNIQGKDTMRAPERYVSKEEMEKIYSEKKVDLSAGEKAKIESIYGN